MSETTASIDCPEHGLQQETFVCQHIVQGLSEGRRVGFFCAHNPENPRPDAWCAECDERVRASGGEWVGEAETHLKAKLLCGACYDLAKAFHTAHI